MKRKIHVLALSIVAARIAGSPGAQSQAPSSDADRLAQLARQRLHEGKLTEPTGDSALYYLNELQKAHAKNAAIEPIARDLTAKLIARGDKLEERLSVRQGLTQAPLTSAPVPHEYHAPALPRPAVRPGGTRRCETLAI
jgi:Asp-tRNA(Asn)/Glu-tRNA(Gln) amidotransferase C subunit